MSVAGTLGVLLALLFLGFVGARCFRQESGKSVVVERRVYYTAPPPQVPRVGGLAWASAAPSVQSFRQPSGVYYGDEISDYSSSEASDLRSSIMSASDATSYA